MAGADTIPKLKSIEQLSQRLGITVRHVRHVRHVRRLVAERRVAYLKIGRLMRFDSAEVAAWLDSRRHPQGFQ